MKKRNGLISEGVVAQVEPVAGVGGVAVDDGDEVREASVCEAS